MNQLLTIDDLSVATGLEESLIRFYESEYSSRLPKKIVRGDGLFFRPEAVAVLRDIHVRHGSGNTSPAPERGYGRVIAVSSGKGGVGKSNLALNLAIEFQRAGHMSLVLDADLGMANIHLLAGVQPRYTLGDFLKDQISISELITPGPCGVGIIPGGAGIMALADSTAHDRRQMLGALESMEKNAEIMVVDTAAGMGAGVRDFLRAADEIIIILTQDITAMADAYGLLKGLKQEGLRGPIYSVVNMTASLKQAAAVAGRFAACATQFLDLRVENIGYIMRDSSFAAATARRTPLNVFAPQSRAAKNIRNIAGSLLRGAEKGIKMNSAFKRYMKMVNIEAEEKK